MMSANEKKVLIVLVGTIRIEYSPRDGVGRGGERRDGKRGWGGYQATQTIIHRLRDAESSSTQDSLLFPLPFPLSSPS
jgi:hypothetical protein